MRYAVIAVIFLFVLAACATQSSDSKAKQIAKDLKENAEKAPAPAKEVVKENVSVPAQVEPKQSPTTVVSEKPVQKVVVANEDDSKAGAMTNESDGSEETTAPARQITMMQKLVDAYAKKVTGYQFRYNKGMYFVKGQKFKVVLDDQVLIKNASLPPNVTGHFFYFDTVYVDRSGKSAVAYCEGHKAPVDRQCKQMNLYDLPYDVDFEEYNIVLPADWLLSYLDKRATGVDEKKYYVNSLLTTVVKFDDALNTQISFDPQTGLAVRADQTKEGALSRFEYRDLASNRVRDVDVQHRSKAEIPTEEMFYKGPAWP